MDSGLDMPEDRSVSEVGSMSSDPCLTRVDRVDGVAVVTFMNTRLNTLSATVRRQILNCFELLADDEDVLGIVLTSSGDAFSAGADMKSFSIGADETLAARLSEAVDGCRKPVVAAVYGRCLGGGLELALSCHHRVAVPSAKLGLPEVKVGLVPGAGGTQFLPRIVGPRIALSLILSGEPVGADLAHRWGLVDGIAAEGDLLPYAIAFAKHVSAGNRTIVRLADRSGTRDWAVDDPQVFDDFRARFGKHNRGVEAPAACVACVEAACRLPLREGLSFERKTFLERLHSEESRAQRYLFFAERRARKIRGLGPHISPHQVTRVGIVGSGTMGHGIALACLQAGYPVTLTDADSRALERGIGSIERRLRRSAEKGELPDDGVASQLRMLGSSTDLSSLADCDLVIEAVYEDIEIKVDLLGRLSSILAANAIVATNTSYLSVDEIAQAYVRPEQVIGLHFFSPANIMALLEVVRGRATSDRVLATGLDVARRLGKVPVVVGVCHGFVGNRMLARRRQQADALLLAGASPQDIDRVLEDFGMPMGPFAMSDLAGLDLGWSAERSTGATVREVLCERGRRGQKAGKGYYDYDGDRRRSSSPEVQQVVSEFADRHHIQQRGVSSEEILERCLFAMVNEGARILQEGVAARASDIDLVWVHGYRWPVYRGGPMYWADQIGLGVVESRLAGLSEAHGEAFKPAALLVELARSGRRFADFDASPTA